MSGEGPRQSDLEGDPDGSHCLRAGLERHRLGIYTFYIKTTTANAMTTSSPRKEALLLNFKVDTLTSVSRTTLRRIAKALGFSETQAVHFALARLREDALRGEDASYPPLTKAQLTAIRKHEPKRKGRVLSSLLR
jgi:hypothetical protein